MTAAPVMIMAGGTGGHVFPALAIARALEAQDQPVVWLGTRAGLEARVIPAEGIPMHWVRVSGLRKKGWLSWLLAPFRLMVAMYDAVRAVLSCKPRLVLGMGGFASGPGGVAAWLLRRPLVIHEQNAAAGLTNRLLARLARRVLQAFPGAFAGREDTAVTGNPVRAEFLAVPAPDERFAGREGPLRIFVVGGSLGALVLNQTVPAALAMLPADQRPQVRHQAGRATASVARDAYADAAVDAEVIEFVDDMAGMYAWADLVICRAGALTVAELAAVGVASVLVPYPHAVDDHQTLNGRYLSDAGAATLLPQPEATAERLRDEILKAAADRGELLERARRARELARPSATDDIVAACLAEARAA